MILINLTRRGQGKNDFLLNYFKLLTCFGLFAKPSKLIMRFAWDPQKAKQNLKKHGVSFEEGVTALKDPLAATGADPDHSITENRYITFGVSEKGRLLVVSHTEKGGHIRIISTRKASKGERELYEEE